MCSPTLQIRCLPSLSDLVYGLVGFGISAFALGLLWLPQSSADSVAPEQARAISVSCALLFGGIGVLLACMKTCHEIEANEAGLRWRRFPGIGAWKQARWDEVEDFYLEDNPFRCMVQTEPGTLAFEKGDGKCMAALCKFIAERAKRAPCREWRQRGSRSDERWPIIFEYGSEDARMMLGASILVGLPTLTFAGFRAAGVFRSVQQHGWNNGRLPDLILGAATFILFEAAAGFLAYLAYRSLGRSDRIAVDEHGIAWVRKQSIVEADWAHVRSIYYRGMSGIVDTGQAQIEFASLINNAQLLHRLLRRYAPEAMARGTREHPGISFLIGPPEIRPGEQVFVYRTKLNFVAACIPTFFTLMGLFVSSQETVRRWWPEWDAHFVHNTPTELAISSVLTIAMALLSIWLWWRLFAGKVVLNSEAITQHGPFGVRSIKWADVHAITTWRRLPPFSFYVVQGPASRLLIWASISDVLELETEINRHVPEHVPKVRLLPAACYDEPK